MIGADSPLRQAVIAALDTADLSGPAGECLDVRVAPDAAALPYDLRAVVMIAGRATQQTLTRLATRVPTIVVASSAGGGAALDAIRLGARDWLCAAEVASLPQALRRELATDDDGFGINRVAACLVASLTDGAGFDEYCDRLARSFDATHVVLLAPDRAGQLVAIGIGGGAARDEVRLEPADLDSMCGESATALAAAEQALGVPAGAHRVWTRLAGGDGGAGAQLIARVERPFSAAERAVIEQLAGGAAMAVERWRAVAQLRRTDAVKTEFVRTVSHELRTPLNTVIGYADLLVEEAFGPLEEEQRRILRRVGDRARGLLEVIAATLDLPGVDGGRVSLETRPVSVGDLLAELEADTRAWGVRDDLTLTWEVASDLPALTTDLGKLRVLLKNLIANALKFTDRGGIAVRARQRDGGIELSVEDTGIGIEGEAVHFVFDAFRQANAAATGKYGGVGLGLYIVRRLVAMLGGRLRVESEVGVGSKFHVWLPTDPSNPH